MTDLLSRPVRGASRDERKGRPSGAPRGAGGSRLGRAWARLRGQEERSLAGAAALAALGAVVGGLAVVMVLALAGWYLAEAGAYGTTTSALVVAVQVWLLSHGATLSIGGVPLGLVPWTVTLGQAYLLWRLARRAGRAAPGDTDDRTLLQAATVLVGTYLVTVTTICALAGTGPVSASIPGAVLGSLVLAALAGPWGLAVGTGRVSELLGRVPGWVRAVVHGGLVSAGLLLAVAALLLVVALGFGYNDAMALLAGLRLDTGDQVAYGGATLLLVPNAVAFAAAYLLGPGFAVGAGSVVSPSAVVLGPVPAFPLLAALPDPGPTPSWLIGVVAVPVAAAVVGAARAQLGYGVLARDSAALRGFGSGVVGGLLLTVLVWAAGGPVGDGRLAQVGAPVGEVLVLAVGSMSVAGLVSGSVVAWWQRRRDQRGSAAEAVGD